LKTKVIKASENFVFYSAYFEILEFSFIFAKYFLLKSKIMEAVVNLTYDQIFSLVKQLPRQQKIRLSEELEKDSIGKQLSSLLTAFKTDELSLNIIDEEVEIVRQQIYEREKIKN